MTFSRSTIENHKKIHPKELRWKISFTILRLTNIVDELEHLGVSYEIL